MESNDKIFTNEKIENNEMEKISINNFDILED